MGPQAFQLTIYTMLLAGFGSFHNALAQTTQSEICRYGTPEKVALDACETVLKNETNDYIRSSAFAGRARVLYELKKYDSALSDINRAIEIYPNGERYYQRGTIFSAKNDSDNSIADFTSSIKLERDDAKALFARGVEYLRKNDYDHAIMDFDNALRIDPTESRALFGRGVAKNLKFGDKSGESDIAQVKGYLRSNHEAYFVGKGLKFNKVADAQGPVFCSQLRHIASQAPDAFRKLRTSRDADTDQLRKIDPTLHVTLFQTNELLPGADKCSISISDKPELFGRTHPYFDCTWYYVGDVEKAWLSSQASALSGAVAACFSTQTGGPDSDEKYEITAADALFRIRLNRLPSYSRISISIEKELTPLQSQSCGRAAVFGQRASPRDKKICLDSYLPQ